MSGFFSFRPWSFSWKEMPKLRFGLLLSFDSSRTCDGCLCLLEPRAPDSKPIKIQNNSRDELFKPVVPRPHEVEEDAHWEELEEACGVCPAWEDETSEGAPVVSVPSSSSGPVSRPQRYCVEERPSTCFGARRRLHLSFRG